MSQRPELQAARMGGAELRPDESIVADVLGGDLASFEFIMRRYNQRLFRVARSILGDDDEAEDVVQETYLRAFRALSRFEGRARFSTWLTKIAVHEASARRRRTSRLRLMGSDDCDRLAHPDDEAMRAGEREVDMSELRGILTRAIDALEPDLRSVFVLRMVEGMDTRHTAECLDITPANVKVRLHRARERLKERIDTAIGEETRRVYQFDGARCDRIVQTVLAQLRRSAH